MRPEPLAGSLGRGSGGRGEHTVGKSGLTFGFPNPDPRSRCSFKGSQSGEAVGPAALQSRPGPSPPCCTRGGGSSSLPGEVAQAQPVPCSPICHPAPPPSPGPQPHLPASSWEGGQAGQDAPRWCAGVPPGGSPRSRSPGSGPMPRASTAGVVPSRLAEAKSAATQGPPTKSGAGVLPSGVPPPMGLPEAASPIPTSAGRLRPEQVP